VSARVTQNASPPRSEFGRRIKTTLRASDPKILSPLDANAMRWPKSSNHYFNWLESVRDNRQPIAPIEQSARSLEACAAAWIA